MSGSVQTPPRQSQTRQGTTGPQPTRVTLGSRHTSNHRSYPAQGHTTSCNRSVCYDQVKACNHDGESVAKAQSLQSNNAFRAKTLPCVLRMSRPWSNFLLFEWMVLVHSPTLKMEAEASEKGLHLPFKPCCIGSQQTETFKNKIYIETSFSTILTVFVIIKQKIPLTLYLCVHFQTCFIYKLLPYARLRTRVVNSAVGQLHCVHAHRIIY